MKPKPPVTISFFIILFFTLDETVSIPFIISNNQLCMSISRQNLTVVIVTFKSQHIIDQCIQSIDNELPVIVVENSKNKDFKNYLERNYKNVSCILSNENIGMGSGNNIGIKYAKTDFVLILNPDVILFNDTIEKLINAGKLLKNFAIMSSISDNNNFPNFLIKKKKKIDYKNFFEVDSVDGLHITRHQKRLYRLHHNSMLRGLHITRHHMNMNIT